MRSEIELNKIFRYRRIDGYELSLINIQTEGPEVERGYLGNLPPPVSRVYPTQLASSSLSQLSQPEEKQTQIQESTTQRTGHERDHDRGRGHDRIPVMTEENQARS